MERVNRVLVVLILLSCVASAAMLWAPTHQNKLRSVFDLGYLIGPATESLMGGHGLLVCTDRMGTPGEPICFRGARMPVAPALLAGLVRLLGDRPRLVDSAKTLLALLPLWLAMALLLRRVNRRSLVMCGVLLAVPLVCLNFLVTATSMEVEEGYTFGLLALALVLVLVPLRRTMGWALAVSGVLVLLYLIKSSMMFAALPIFAAAFWQTRAIAPRAAMVLVCLCAPIGWAAYQHHASGKYSVGTSLDGMNFHKGNRAGFARIYPTSNSAFDALDPELNAGRRFSGEWDYDAYHKAQGTSFLEAHPAETVVGEGKKFSMLYLTVHGYTKTHMGRGASLFASVGMILFRLLLWASIVFAVLAVATGRFGGRFCGATYLLFLGFYSFPYLVGFGFIRHAIVLSYPAAIMACLAVSAWMGERSWGKGDV